MVEAAQFISRKPATASEDDQPDREAVRDAMFLYLSLPQSARRALRALTTLGTDAEREVIAQAAAPAIVRAGFQAARRTAATAAAQTYPTGHLPTEDDIQAEAVRLNRSARANRG
jgi:hypothetical protein